jgi:hypothetical protein
VVYSSELLEEISAMSRPEAAATQGP